MGERLGEGVGVDSPLGTLRSGGDGRQRREVGPADDLAHERRQERRGVLVEHGEHGVQNEGQRAAAADDRQRRLEARRHQLRH